MAAFFVPLVVLPESNFVDITSTPKSTFLRMFGTLQAGVLLSRLALSYFATDENRFHQSLAMIRANRPVFAIAVSIIAIALVSVISASLAILPHQSWWGRVPAGFEAGAYSSLMYIVLATSALISVQEFSRKPIFWNTLAVTGILSALVGFFQFFGWSLFDISSTHNSKLTGTNGNPIFYGAMLIMLAPISLGILLNRYKAAAQDQQVWWLVALGATSYIYLVSLVATGSRGPWLGGATAITAAFIILVATKNLRINIIPIAVVTALSLLGLLTATFVDPTPPEKAPTDSATSTASDNSSVISSGLGNVGRTSTLDLRLRYWELSAEMSTDREPVPYTNDAPKAVRFLFGYGVDMFRFAGTYFSDNTTFTRRFTAAHNDPINRLVEQGLLGLLAWIGLWISLAYGATSLIRRTMASNPGTTPWIPILIAAALAGRFAEQMFGSPTTGGVLVFWLLLGGLAGLLLNTVTQQKTRPKRSHSKPPMKIAVFTGVAIIAIASVVIAWDRGANYLIANQMASFQYRSNAITSGEAIDRLEQAASLAPDVPTYWHNLAEIEHGRAASTDDPVNKANALSKAYEYDRKGHEANPLEVSSVYKLAFSAWEAGNAGRPELRQEAVDLYIYLTEIIPSDDLAKERLQILQDFLRQ